MNRHPPFGHQDGDRMSGLHRLNALHIIETLPRRLYHHEAWGALEISTMPLPPDREKGRRVLIGICHNDFGDVMSAAYILCEDGSMCLYDPDGGKEFPIGIRYAHLQMLLSEVSLHGWSRNDTQANKKYLGDIGLGLEDDALAHQSHLESVMKQVQGAYAQITKF